MSIIQKIKKIIAIYVKKINGSQAKEWCAHFNTCTWPSNETLINHCHFKRKVYNRAYSTLKHSLSTTVLVAFHPGFQIKVPQNNDNTQRLATTETTEQHGNFNLFHFQNDQMRPVNMTGKTKG